MKSRSVRVSAWLVITTFGVTVSHVIRIRAKEEMIDSAAIPPVAPMANADAVGAAVVGYWAVYE